MKCANCSYELAETSRFCPNCGTPNLSLMPKEEPVVEPVEDFVPAEAAPLKPEAAGESMDATQVVREPEAGGFVPPIFTPEAAAAGKKRPIWMFTLGGILVVAVLVVLAILIFGSSGGGNGLVIGMPSRNDTMDVYALKLGQDIKDVDPILEDGSFGNGYAYQVLSNNDYNFLGGWGYTAGFIQNSKNLGIVYDDNGTQSLYLTTLNPKEMKAIFESEDDFYSLILQNGKTVYIREDRGQSVRCYVSQNGKEAEQVAKGDLCELAVNGNRILVSDVSSKGELTVKAYDLKGENEIILLDDEPNIRDGYFQSNNDGTLISIIVEDGDNVKLKLISIKNSEVVAESDPFVDIVDRGMAEKGEAVFFIAENEDGALELNTLKAGEQKLVASGLGIQAEFDQDGENLTYLVSDEDGNLNIRVHPMGKGEDVDVMDGENLSFTLLTSKDILLIMEDNLDKGNLTLYSSKLDGGSLTEIFSDSDVSLTAMYNPTNTDQLLIEVSNQNNQSNVYATRIGSEDGKYLLEDWDIINFVGVDEKGTTLLMSGAEDSGDDTILFALDLTGKNDLVELDDDDIESVMETAFTPDGRKLLYTVQTGDNYDDFEVRQVPVDGDEDYEVLYEESILIDVAWTEMWNIDYIWFDSPIYSSNACPGAIALSLDATLTNKLKSDVGETCFRFKAQADKEYTFFVIGKDDQDLYLNLVDKDGNYLASDDDSGPGYNPIIFWTNGTEPLTVYVQVTGSTSETLDFDLTAKEGAFDPAMASAMLIPVDGSDLSGTVEDADLLDLGIYSGPGDLYYFEGQANQTITIDAMVGGTSSSMDPFIALIDAKQNILESDDNSGTDNDANLTYVLPSADRYYIIVIDERNSSGPDYTYTIKVTR